MNSSSVVEPPSLRPAWMAVYCTAAIAIVTTNSLTIVSFVGLPVPRRARAHIFLINLAVADLLVGFLAIPMYLLRLASLVPSYPFVVVDMTLGLASIFTLTIVALERLYAVFHPFRLRQIPTKTYLKSLPIPWSATAVAVVIFTVYRRGLLSFSSFHPIIVTFLFAPLSVTCLAYLCLWIKVKLRPFHGIGADRDRRLAITLLITTIVFLVTWLPYSVLNILIYYKPSLGLSILRVLPDEGVKLIQYSNSFMNPIIYCMRIPDFRRAMASIVSCRKTARNRGEIKRRVQDWTFTNISFHHEERNVINDMILHELTQSSLHLVRCVNISDESRPGSIASNPS